MKQLNKSKDMHVSTGISQARDFIQEYIGDNLRKFSIDNVGRTIHVSIYYYDFKPEREVRRHIEDTIPNIQIESLEREYSSDNIVEELMSSELSVYVKEDDGCLRPTTACDMIYELLRDVDFTDSKVQEIEV